MTGDWATDQGVECVVCTGCAFTFDAAHTDPDGSYSCPVCAETETASVLRDIVCEQLGSDFVHPELGGSLAVAAQMDGLELARFLAAELREPGSYAPPGLFHPQGEQG